ncbi:MAG TPA: 6-phosphogluconolactonase, partial [Niabella sp.]|nr:6-phosphogluconolactonase [Niabella sp.]
MAKKNQSKSSQLDSLEKIDVEIYADMKAGSLAIAKTIADLIRQKQKAKQKCVLGLATGSSPKLVYAELIRMHKEEKLSFKNVVTFNLDEYYPIKKDAPQSYNTFMYNNLFSHVDINPKNVHIPNGEIEKDNVKAHAAEYEKAIEKAGG